MTDQTFSNDNQTIFIIITNNNKIWTARTWVGADHFFFKQFPNKPQAMAHVRATLGDDLAA